METAGLQPSPETDKTTWLRRVYLDLIGLPPSPTEVTAYRNNTKPDADRQVVDFLLASPRYGERWGQHWLDVVRYADTHGFEVNTERPNAWYYRDYVVGAFNSDLPYNRFIREQIAGDTLGADFATGFLITASVLLPGQIGADEVSKRLARQDALDEIVVNTSQTFLGLSIGCARCHDHKFDPVTAHDYYAMQAFFAGVEYADREIKSPEIPTNPLEILNLKTRLATLDQDLSYFEPLARLGPVLQKTKAHHNEDSFPPITARFIRFTILNANLHPALGLIEPCIDELEIYTDDVNQKNVALASYGTRVTASGSRVSDSHRLEYINDGLLGNAHSWMSDQAGRGWVQFELPKPQTIHRILWSRDREGVFSDRLPTAYSIEVGLEPDSLTSIVFLPPNRPAIKSTANVDRFTPRTTKRLRFSIRATTQLEPCIDELEVFDSKTRNVALAAFGTKLTTSGDTLVPNTHSPSYLHDGLYGNSRSWMSSETGRGWIILEFPEPCTIDRVIWGRDRLGSFTDRLATDYQVEVADALGDWVTVAGSSDRCALGSSELSPSLVNLGRPPAEAQALEALLSKKKTLESQLAAATATRLAFAGVFRKPDVIRLLNRGDPEQPKELIAPAIPAVLGRFTLATNAPETDRRIALANWIASPSNPLTARVMVNRIWQGHFNFGLVETSSDFGKNGTPPSHPELLDWLASEFIRNEWSLKHLHRLIALSSTYRQSAAIDPKAALLDADIRLLWRFPSRRLESESIRDSILSVNGRLDFSIGGRGFDLFDNRGGLSGFKPIESFKGAGLRRMIYAHKIRREREAVFGAFDCPDAGQSTARRRESTTPIQALNLFNSVFTLEQSAAFAEWVRFIAKGTVAEQIQRTYRLALSRDPTASELKEFKPFVEQQGLEVLCRALFNSNEFLFLP